MPLFWFSLTTIFGIFVASIFRFSAIVWLIGITVFLIAGLYEYRFYRRAKRKIISLPLFRIPFAFLILGLFIGGFRYQSALPATNPGNVLGYLSKENIILIGTVKSDPIQTSDFTTAIIKSEFVKRENKILPIDGDIAILLPAGFKVFYGDHLELNGILKKTYRDNFHLLTSNSAIQNIFARMSFPEVTVLSYRNGNRIMDLIYRLREKAHVIIYELIPFPESSILSGILLGIEGDIPNFLWDSYRASGTMHIIAISGFNITIIAFLAFQVFKRILGWKWTLPATAITILLYTVLVGADPPVVRAAIMGIIALLAHYIGRRSIGVYSLVLTAFVMLMKNPFLLWSTSFQLSFLATLALLIIIDPLDGWISEKLENYISAASTTVIMPIVSIITTTFSANLVILPILIKLNPDISTINLFANFLIGPLQPMIMIFGGLAVLFGFFIPPSLNFMRILVWPLIAFCDRIAIRLSMNNYAVVPMPTFAFRVSLIISVFLLVYFSYQNILSLTNPKIDRG